MKIRNYEKITSITIIIILISIIELILVLYLFRTKEYTYIKLTGIVVKDNLVTLIVDDYDKKLLHSNNKIYLEDKDKKYKIKEDKGVVLKRNNKDYYEILIEVNFSKDKKVNEVLEFTLRNNKKRLIEIFKDIWEGG